MEEWRYNANGDTPPASCRVPTASETECTSKSVWTLKKRKISWRLLGVEPQTVSLSQYPLKYPDSYKPNITSNKLC
jgi:hypothetical protein